MHTRTSRDGWRGFVLFCSLVILLSFPSAVFAAKGQGHLEEVDFSCRGVYLGDTEEKLLEVFGAPLYDKQIGVYGIAVKYYSFGRDIDIGVSVRTHKVVDILIKGRKYKARGGVRYGATSYKITKTFGAKERTLLDGVIYYIYEHPDRHYDRLMLAVDSEKGSLASFRITSLPLTDEEADRMAIEDDVSNELSVLLAGEKEIDTSAMPSHEQVKVRGLEK